MRGVFLPMNRLALSPSFVRLEFWHRCSRERVGCRLAAYTNALNDVKEDSRIALGVGRGRDVLAHYLRNRGRLVLRGGNLSRTLSWRMICAHVLGERIFTIGDVLRAHENSPIALSARKRRVFRVDSPTHKSRRRDCLSS
jgi:hypothetical protein